MNQERIGVSIVVPCYKVENYIRELIESILKQTFKAFELILVDDGSPDKTGEICDEYAQKDGRIKVIHKENAGVSAARNDGLAIATGEYVIFSDSDDYLPEDAIEILYQKAVDSNADIIIGDVNQIFDDHEKMGKFYAEEFVTQDPKDKQELIKADLYKTYCPWPYEGNAAFGYGGPWNKLVRREMLTDNGIKFDARTKGIFDDIIYSAYILAVADKVAYVPRNVYNYRILESSITHTFKANVLEINDAIFTVWGEFLDKYNKDGTFTAAYYANVLRRFDDSIQRYFFNPKNPKSKSERLQELQTVMDSAPYKDIPKYVEIGKLERRHLEECKLLKKGSAKGVQCFYSLMGVWRRLKGKS